MKKPKKTRYLQLIEELSSMTRISPKKISEVLLSYIQLTLVDLVNSGKTEDLFFSYEYDIENKKIKITNFNKDFQRLLTDNFTGESILNIVNGAGL